MHPVNLLFCLFSNYVNCMRVILLKSIRNGRRRTTTPTWRPSFAVTVTDVTSNHSLSIEMSKWIIIQNTQTQNTYTKHTEYVHRKSVTDWIHVFCSTAEYSTVHAMWVFPRNVFRAPFECIVCTYMFTCVCVPLSFAKRPNDREGIISWVRDPFTEPSRQRLIGRIHSVERRTSTFVASSPSSSQTSVVSRWSKIKWILQGILNACDAMANAWALRYDIFNFATCAFSILRERRLKSCVKCTQRSSLCTKWKSFRCLWRLFQAALDYYLDLEERSVLGGNVANCSIHEYWMVWTNIQYIK